MKYDFSSHERGMAGMLEIGLVVVVIACVGVAAYVGLRHQSTPKTASIVSTARSTPAPNTPAAAVDQSVSTLLTDPSDASGDTSVPDDSTATAQNQGGIDESTF